ncbi:LAMI_0E15962g1_1 [Lachancea mirantina]|uniref:LAMI_0E15962g1_1 n=1 Tax=Lachancea mirantina TaxID=1230905 RepID=A0A1G4JSQ8_9SACH|nr:LAMI_0E15962g1_1 [Lachancea mirantina]
MRLSVMLMAGLAAAEVANIYDRWTTSDLEQFLKDEKHGVQKSGRETLESLRKSAAEVWDKSAKPVPWWKFWDQGNAAQRAWARYYAAKEPVADWLFSTWSDSQLRQLLKRSKVKVQSDMSRDRLAALARENFDKISHSVDSSGLYPSEGYFKDWSDADLKNWLREYHVSFDDAREKRDALLASVREHMYKASEYADDERKNLLETLDVANQQLLDKAGNVKDAAFDKWSTRELEEWLQSHKVAIRDKAAAEYVHDRDYLLKQAEKHKNYLKDDLEWYASALQKQASPILSKSEDAVMSVWESTKGRVSDWKNWFVHDDNIVNHTFLIGVETWPKKKLRAFLDARNVPYSMLSTRATLLDLVKQYRNRPLTNVAKSPQVAEFFDGWSYENVRNWVQAKNEDSMEVYQKASDKVSELVSQAQQKGADAVDYTQQKGKDAADYAQQLGKDAADYAQKKGKDAAEYTQQLGKEAADYTHKKGKDALDYTQQKGADAVDYAQQKGADAADEWTHVFKTWTVEDLTDYVKSFGIKPQPTSTKDKLVEQAKENAQWFFGYKPEPFYKRVPKKLKNALTNNVVLG